MIDHLIVRVCLVATVIAATGCGSSIKDQETLSKCISRCGLASMSCLESSSCVDLDGQLIPCENQCEAEREKCEQECG
ncbi:MAG: hypothetical protein GY847_29780 [Proteobacteria bacterium]|nr:hypothetical protein [Pseudomonadota bacterium]